MDATELAHGFLTQRPGEDPYPLYRRLREHAPVITVGGFTLVTRYEDCHSVVRDPAFRVLDSGFRDRTMPWWRDSPALRMLTENLVFTNPPQHTPIRRVIASVFTQRKVAGMRLIVERRVDHLVTRLIDLGADGEVVDFIDEFADLVPLNVVADLLGIPEEDRGWFRPLVGDLTRALDPFWTRGQLAAADRAAVRLDPYCYEAPTQVLGRYSTVGAQIAGPPVPAWNQIVVMLGSANRDPDRFRDPDAFDPFRPDNTPLRFGSGSHFCAGAALARLEAREALCTVLRRVPDLAPAGRPTFRPRRTIRSFQTMPVRTAPGGWPRPRDDQDLVVALSTVGTGGRFRPSRLQGWGHGG